MKFVVLGTGFPDIVQTIEDILLKDKSLEFIGFLDDDERKSKKTCFGYEVLGSIDWLHNKPKLGHRNFYLDTLNDILNIIAKKEYYNGPMNLIFHRINNLLVQLQEI